MILNKRERYSIYLAIGFTCLFVLIQFIISPMIDKKNHLKRSLQVKTKIIEEMLRLQSEYQTIKNRADSARIGFEKRKKDFTLFSFLDELAGKTGIKEHISYMKPSKTPQKNSPYQVSSVEMKLQDIGLVQLTAYLHGIETSENMAIIKRISISKTSKQEGFIDAVLQIETLEI
ncbi:MAG: hypothetical protein JW786_14940 [Desulfobacterales bacterium]|nr:hypothetical protein [Desulfobacterales bacterium]